MLLAHIAEVDDRGLYRAAGYPSMFAYCVGELRFSEDAAYKRIRAARAGRKFSELFTALADGRLHLAALYLLAPHFTPENLDELIKAATHRSKSDIEELVAARFGTPGSPASLRPMIRVVAAPSPMPNTQLTAAPVDDELLLGESSTGDTPLGSPHQENYGQLAPGPVEGTQVQSLPQNCPVFLVRLTVPKSTRDKLHYAQALLSHAVPLDDLAQVLDRALDALIKQLEVRKFGAPRDPRRREEGAAADREQRSVEGSEDAVSDGVSRYIPASVRRAVWERDQGRCTFISITGGRCRVRMNLEIDHVVPVARGGKATVANLRLRCASHNQLEAERAFGEEFMRRKRREAFASRYLGAPADHAGEIHPEDTT
jgi:hypothetical protein